MTTVTQKNPAAKAILDRCRNRVNALDKLAQQMRDSSDPKIQEQHAPLVSIIADLRTEFTNWQELET
jgi:hypothetical protein